MSNPIQPDSIQLAILYAAPLVYQDQEELYSQEILNFETECGKLFDSLSEAGREIKVRVEAATVENLRMLVTLGCRVLHYSGHGSEDFLDFEDGRGGTHELDADTLKQLFAAGGTRGVECVFVSACESRQAGEAFVKAGVPHVVAVRLEEAVYDDAAIAFAGAFYLALAVGKTVNQAFEIGRERVAALPNLPEAHKEAEKFLLLPEYGKHDVAIFDGVPAGEWRDSTPPLPPHNLPAMPEYFIGRNVDWQQVIAKVLEGRLVTLRGGPGIGKTALATATAHYINERRLFRDGTFFVSMRGVRSVEAARFAIARALRVEARDEDELFAALRPRHCLLVLDNCEDPLHHAPTAFRQFLSQLLQQARYVKLLLTSRHAVGGGLSGVSEQVHQLRRLSPLEAAHLFSNLAPRSLTLSEVGTNNPEKFFDTLAQHPALTFLSGHPQAVALTAPLLADKSLAQLHDLLQAQTVDALLVADIPEDERDATNSFAVSLGVSVDYVRERNPEAVRLFAVMGLLPSGALPQDLDAIWGDSWRPLMDALVRASLVERMELSNTEHFSTFPFVTAYAERLLTAGDRTRFATRACEYFGKMSEAIYRAMGTENAVQAQALLEVEELNLRACLDLRRPIHPKREDEGLSPTGYVASHLPSILLLVDRAHDGIHVAKLGCEACRRMKDPCGEANTLQAMGDCKLRMDDLLGARADYERALDICCEINEHHGKANLLVALGNIKMRSYDLVGARTDYETALPIYCEISDLFGEANCRRGVGNLRRIEGQLDAAMIEFRAAFEISIKIPDRLGVAADLSYLGQAVYAAEQYGRAALFFEIALSFHRAIKNRHGEALDLAHQAEAFLALEIQQAMLAARWQALEIFRTISDSLAIPLNQFFAGLEEALGAKAYREIVAGLQAHAEEWRLATVAELRQAAANDTFLQEIITAVRTTFGS